MNKPTLLTLLMSAALLTACNGGSSGGGGGGGSVLTSNPQPFQQFYANGSPLNPNNFGSTKSWSSGSGDLNFTFYGSSNYGGGVSLTLSGTVNLNNTTCATLADSDNLATMTLTNCSQSINNNNYVLTATATGGGAIGSGVSNLSITTPVLPSGTYTNPSNCYNISVSGTSLSAVCLASNGYTTYNPTLNIASCPNGPISWNSSTHVLACS